MWKIIYTPKSAAQEIMAKDAFLLEGLENEPILHFYEWSRPSATYGMFTEPKNFLKNLELLDLAKRPTGGGIIFHISDFAFSVLIPRSHPRFSQNTLENYALINEAVGKTVEKLTRKQTELLPLEPMPQDPACKFFCMAKPTKYDVMVQGRKVGGAAQRQTRRGFLHQGSVCVANLPPSFLDEVLLPGTAVLAAMQQNSFSLLPNGWNQQELKQMRGEVRALLQTQITSV